MSGTREERVQKAQDDAVQAAWSQLLSIPEGRLVLWSILDRCGCFNFGHHGNDLDLLHKGKQQVGAAILESHVFPNGVQIYADMLLEAEKRDILLQDAVDRDIEEELKED